MGMPCRVKQHCQSLRKTRDFNRIHQQGHIWRTRGLTLKAATNGLEFSRWGFIVSRKVGAAVLRNRIKRMLREILRQEEVKPGWDLVVVTHPSIVSMDFHTLKSVVLAVLSKAGLAGKR